MAKSPEHPDSEKSPSSAEQRRREAAQRKRERILEASALLFAEQGFHKTTVDEIAQAASISKGLVYVHFPSKEDLLEAVLGRASNEWVQATRTQKRDAERRVAERIAETLRASFRYAQANPILRGILAQDPRLLLPQHRGDLGGPILKKYRENLEQILQHGIERGEVREELDARHTAEAIGLVHHALIEALFVSPAGRSSERQETLVEATIALILKGIQP